MNRGISSIVAFASLILLAGCTISGGGDGGGGGGGPFPGETPTTVTVQPQFSSPAVQSNVTLEAGQSRLYKVDISQSVAEDNDVVYFDAVPQDETKVDGHLEMVAYEVTGTQANELYVSQTNDWFGHPDDPGLLSLQESGGFVPAAVGSAAPSCGGPCIVVPTPSEAGTAYVRVKALQGTVTFDLYVVATDFFDLSEPNDTVGNAEFVNSASASGTLEVIGDVDWYETVGNVSKVTFHANNDVNQLASVCTLGGSCRTLSNGGVRNLSSAQPVRVEVFSDELEERAAAAGKATYSIEFQ